MTETVKNGDFVEIEYTGLLKEDGFVFDTTNESLAKKEGIFDPKMTYGPVAICIGQGQILKGLDSSLEGLPIGTETEVELEPEKAFGKKDAKLLQLVPTSIFKKEGIRPAPGLQVQIDGAMGTIRTVSGGRTVVDFNHPFSGKEVIYKVKIIRKLTDEKEKVKSLIHLSLNQLPEAIGVNITGEKCTVTLKKDFNKELLDFLKQRIKKTMPEIKEVEFETEGKVKINKENSEKKEVAKKPAE